jgi:hypothetical protein
VRVPWLSRRWDRAEEQARQAERELRETRVELAKVHRIVAESRDIKKENGFTEAVRAAMGVRR